MEKSDAYMEQLLREALKATSPSPSYLDLKLFWRPREEEEEEEEPNTVEGIPHAILTASQKIGEDRKAFRRMLETYVPQVGYSAPDSPRILNLGCGICHEAFVLSGYFGGKPYGYESQDAFVVGIDVDKRAIERDRERHKTDDFSTCKFVEKPNYQFIHGDARRLRELVNGEFDVVVTRHPEILHNTEVWRQIYGEVSQVHKTGGLLLASFYMATELSRMKDFISDYNIKIATRNPFGRPLSESSPVISDQFVLMAIKK